MLDKYVDFNLYIKANGHVTASSPEGEIEDRISIQVPRNIRLSLKLIEKRQTDADLLKEVGQSLYDLLFPNKIHTHLHQTEAAARGNNTKLRLRLRIEPPAIASLPLEFIYRAAGGYFLAAHPNTVLSRYLNLPLPPEKVRRREGPLHMLAIVADPTDQVRLEPNEWETILKKALSKPLNERKITLHTVKRATRKEIRNALLAQKPDIIQFIGHGIYENGKGYLALVDEETDKTWRVDDERFANIFAGYDDSLGLISLATCDSAQSDDPQGFLGIAPQLVQRGTPAVVAMQYQVYVKTAKVFLEDFYTCVAAQKPIDWAVQSARNAVSLEFELDNREFATPVLYMRAEDGNVFGKLPSQPQSPELARVITDRDDAIAELRKIGYGNTPIPPPTFNPPPSPSVTSKVSPTSKSNKHWGKIISGGIVSVVFATFMIIANITKQQGTPISSTPNNNDVIDAEEQETPSPSPTRNPDREIDAGKQETPSPSVTRNPDPESELHADYSKLERLFAEGKWEEADREAAKIMLQVAGRQSQAWLDRDSIYKFPCSDLKKINELWVKYSDGHFGYTVQKPIYLETGNKPGTFNGRTYEVFGKRVGWYQNENWLKYDRLTFDLGNSPKGHLPAPHRKTTSSGFSPYNYLMDRLTQCDL